MCNICSWEAGEAKRVKQHITKKHRDRPLDSDDEDEDSKKLKKDESNLLDESNLDQFDKTGMITSTQKLDPDDILDMFDENGKPLMSDETRTAMENTGDITVMEKEEGEDNMQVDNQRLAEIELELVNTTKEISSMEESMKVKDDIIQINDDKINSLEIDGL